MEGDGHGTLLVGAAGPHPGGQVHQTVPRAELYAVYAILLNVTSNVTIEVNVDAASLLAYLEFVLGFT